MCQTGTNAAGPVFNSKVSKAFAGALKFDSDKDAMKHLRKVQKLDAGFNTGTSEIVTN